MSPETKKSAGLIRAPLRAGISPGRSCACLLVLALAALPARTLAQTEPPPFDPDQIRARCSSVHAIDDQSLVFGYVLDARTGTPLPGSVVHLSWKSLHGVADTTLNHAQAETVDGAYIFCDVPQRTQLTAWADALGRSGGRTGLWFTGGESERHDFVLSLAPAVGGLAGRLVDQQTGAPIEAAHIEVAAVDADALTDAGGRFRFTHMPGGTFEAAVRHVAYGRSTLSFVVEPGRTTHLEIRLSPEPIAVDPIEVTIDMRPQWLEQQGFYERAGRGFGEFVTPEAIRQNPWRRFSEVLRGVPGVHISNVCRPQCSQVIQMSTTGSACTPTFYVDGHKMTTVRERVVDLDALAPSGDLQAVEVYRGISQTPPQFYGLCGSIVIWTKRGSG
ncbi:MAG: carboxypeptidase regulatory-like domain-containing protein [Gemmatimonadota bacterium]